MDPITGLITGGLSLLGGIFSSNTSAQNTQANIAMQQQTNQMNMQEAQMNRDFQNQMSSTAYQRATKDMQAAGLNPAMMFGSGSAASTPGGSMPTLQSPTSNKTSPMAGLGDAVKIGMASAVQSKEMDKISEMVANLDLQNKDLQRKLDAGSPEAGVEKTRAETAESMSRWDLNKQMGNIRLPEEIRGKIFSGAPDWLKNALVYGSSAKELTGYGSGAVKDILSTVPGIGKLFGNDTASGKFTPGQRQELKDTFGDLWDSRVGSH